MKKRDGKKRLIFTVTNDLSYDQRMIRICTSLATHGYHVELVGRTMSGSRALEEMPFVQKRLKCFFESGFAFYAEFNIRLLLYLLFRKAHLLCAIDLDTILPVYFVSRICARNRVYDAHELFCEMKEVSSRPRIYKIWKKIESFAVPRFRSGYTVNGIIAQEFYNMYGVEYAVVRNLPKLLPLQKVDISERYVIYQGAVNEGRSFETLIPAFSMISIPLLVCGDGNFMNQARELVAKYRLEQKVRFTGKLLPAELRNYTAKATLGVTLFDDVGLSNYYSLANRFFDYMHAGIPQICVDFPVYRQIVDQYPFAVLIKDISAENIATEVNSLLSDADVYDRLRQNSLAAREVLNWQKEEKVLLDFYAQIFHD